MREAVVDRDPGDETPARLPWDVLLWRQERLVEAGYSVLTAMRLAEDPGVDLHLAVELIQAGASPEVALRILL